MKKILNVVLILILLGFAMTNTVKATDEVIGEAFTLDTEVEEDEKTEEIPSDELALEQEEKEEAGIMLMATAASEFDYSELSDGTIEITGYNGSSTTVEIPSTIDGKSVTSIGKQAFYGMTNITSIDTGDSVTTIGYGAFASCTNLTSITLGSSVTTIDSYAFNVTGITSITIPSSVTFIDSIAFLNATSLTEINVASGNSTYTSVDGVLFSKDKTKLITYPTAKADSSYTIPSTVTVIRR